ncbi:MAG TPA: hypothetical protein VEJ38_09090 [Candidatus Acidoferrales bacterium]|nr:hypothetical protein [Candidatus Acidoferrales bacterium]
MGPLNANKTGLVLGALLGGWHFIWAILVALGWAQAVLNFVLWMHFIQPIYVVRAFNIGTAAVLVAVTAVFGYVIGYVFATLWNRIHR